jgi:hypothetical protein
MTNVALRKFFLLRGSNKFKANLSRLCNRCRAFFLLKAERREKEKIVQAFFKQVSI